MSDPLEKQIENGILTYLWARGIFAWKAEKATGRGGRKHSSKFHMNGIPDILGVLPGGRLLAIEVKTKTGRVSDSQREFIEIIQSKGALAFVARTIGEVETVLNGAL